MQGRIGQSQPLYSFTHTGGSATLQGVRTRDGGVDIQSSGVIEFSSNVSTDSGTNAGPIFLSGTNISLQDDITLHSDHASGMDGALTIQSAVNSNIVGSNRRFEIQAGSGNVMLSGTIGGLRPIGDLVIQAGDVSTPAISANGTVNITAGGDERLLTIGGALTASGAITLAADKMAVNAAISASGQTVTLKPVAGDAINLGSTGGSLTNTLELSVAELDRVSAGTIQIGDSNSGAIRISDAISRPVATNVSVTTGGNNSVTFIGSSASLDANGGNVTITLNGAGSGSVVSGGAATDITADDVSITGGSGGIGTSGNPLTMSATTLTTDTNDAADGAQFLSELNSLTIAAADLDASTSTITLNSGTFLTSATGSILSPVTIASGATLGGTGTSGTVTANSGGTVAPGTSPGVLNAGNVSFASGSNFNIELNGASLTPTAQYDQVNVTGLVTLNDANLNVTLGYTPADGDSFVIIDNDAADAVLGIGTFKVGGVTVADGGSLMIGATRFVIDYTGGSNNNDVVLTVQDTPASDITVGGFLVTNVVENGSNVSGDADLPFVGSVHLVGTVQNGHYSVSTTLSSVAIGSFSASSVQVTLDDNGLGLAGAFQLPVLNSIQLTGTIQNLNQYSFNSPAITVSVGSYSLANTVITVSPNGISLTGTASLPVLGNVPLSGTIQSASDYSISSPAFSQSIGGYSVSNVIATVSQNGLKLTGDANLPLLGDVHLTGPIQSADQFSFSTQPIADITVGPFSLKNTTITVSNLGLSVEGDVDLPLVETVHVEGSIQDIDNFSFSTEAIPDLDLLGFSLTNNTVSIGSAGIQFSGTTDLPVVGEVELSGEITDASTFEIQAELQPLSVLGGVVEFANPVLTLTPDAITFTAHADVLEIGDADFTGSFYFNGDYALTAEVGINVAGFEIDGVNLSFGNDSSTWISPSPSRKSATSRSTVPIARIIGCLRERIPVPSRSAPLWSLTSPSP